MYTAVSLVQARNSDNAKEVAEAMRKHAEMGSEQRRRRQQEQQQQQQSDKKKAGGEIDGTTTGDQGVSDSVTGGYVARRQGSVGLSGDLETDAARQASMA